MEAQTLLNVSFGIIGLLFGWVLNSTRDSIKALHDSDAALADKVQKIEVIVAGKYVQREEMAREFGKIASSLLRIEGKLDGKQDK